MLFVNIVLQSSSLEREKDFAASMGRLFFHRKMKSMEYLKIFCCVSISFIWFKFLLKSHQNCTITFNIHRLISIKKIFCRLTRLTFFSLIFLKGLRYVGWVYSNNGKRKRQHIRKDTLNKSIANLRSTIVSSPIIGNPQLISHAWTITKSTPYPTPPTKISQNRTNNYS